MGRSELMGILNISDYLFEPVILAGSRDGGSATARAVSAIGKVPGLSFVF
jgi:hypothetical protein